MQKEFEEASFALKPGEISPVIETASGLHLIERYVLSFAPLHCRNFCGLCIPAVFVSAWHDMRAAVVILIVVLTRLFVF